MTLRLALLCAALTALCGASGPGARCAGCHPDEVAAYRATGMGRSISRPEQHHSGSFFHPASRSLFTILSTPEGVTQRISRGGVSATRRVEYVIGSGNAAFGYLVRIGDAVFQSPAAYYTRQGKFDMAPGMETLGEPDFNRPATPECLWCHSGRPRALPDTVNRYEEDLFAAAEISCDRCHGSPADHLRRPSDSNIVNPAKLEPALRDSVCEQCHLSGEARVLHPGKDYGDFRPGMLLEDVLSVYVFENQDGAEFKVVSHAEQLQRSRCYQASAGEMWCGSCHNPHESPAGRAAHYRGRCLSCHSSLDPGHGAPSADCAGCHMQTRQSRDSGHSAFTDHQILRKPGNHGPGQQNGSLAAWREPEPRLRERNLGIAYVEAGEQKGSSLLIQRGLELLTKAQRDFPDDAALWDWVALAEMRVGSPQRAVRASLRAVDQNPRFALYRTALAAAYWKSGDAVAAMEALERAMDLDPGLESAYHLLAELKRAAGDKESARAVWRRYLGWNPKSLVGRARSAGNK